MDHQFDLIPEGSYNAECIDTKFKISIHGTAHLQLKFKLNGTEAILFHCLPTYRFWPQALSEQMKIEGAFVVGVIVEEYDGQSYNRIKSFKKEK